MDDANKSKVFEQGETDRLNKLIESWIHTAKCRMASVERQPANEEFGRRFIANGATIYFNCARELEQAMKGEGVAQCSSEASLSDNEK